MAQLSTFVPDFAHMAHGIKRMVAKNAIFQWGAAEDEEFQMVKEAFQSPTLLVPYDPTKEIEAVLAACNIGLAYLAFQKHEEDKYRIIAVGSTGL